jgi:hypothetical protein
MLLPLEVFCEVTSSDPEVVQHFLATDRYKFYQHINACFRIEQLPMHFYEQLVGIFIINEGEGGDFATEEMDKMLRTKPSSSAHFPHIDELRYGYLLKIMTLRGKSGGNQQFSSKMQMVITS